MRALEIISEASRRLPDDLLRRHPEIDWAAVAAAGNVYRHEYEAVDEALIWHTVRHGVAALRSVAEEEMYRLQANPPPAARRGRISPHKSAWRIESATARCLLANVQVGRGAPVDTS